MDVEVYPATVFVLFNGAIIALAIVLLLCRIGRRGESGEDIAAKISDTLQKNEARNNARYDSKTFYNLVLFSGYNTIFTEIDEVIVSQYGIFCVELKSHVGYIRGSKWGERWTQYRYDRKTDIYSPLRQNYKHIKSLEMLLGRNLKKPIHSFVVFTGAKTVTVNDNRVLSGRNDLNHVLEQYIDPIYTEAEFNKICRLFRHAELISPGRLPRHIEETKAYIAAISV